MYSDGNHVFKAYISLNSYAYIILTFILQILESFWKNINIIIDQSSD